MAHVIRNPDGSFTTTMSAKELQALARLGDEQAMTPTLCLETQTTAWVAQAVTDFLNADWPAKQSKYAGLTVAKQAQIEAILNGG